MISMTTIHAERQGRADLHVHTTWSDGAQRPEAVVAAASGRVDVLAITDHDEIRGALAAREYARRQPDLGVDVIVGEEISTLNGHLLGLFLEERVRPGLTALRTIELIRSQGGLAVAAHPFHPVRGRARGYRAIGELAPDLPLDAIEVVNNMPGSSRGSTMPGPPSATPSGCCRSAGGATRTTSGTSAAPSLDSRGGTPSRSAGPSPPVAPAPTGRGPGPRTSCRVTSTTSHAVSTGSCA